MIRRLRSACGSRATLALASVLLAFTVAACGGGKDEGAIAEQAADEFSAAYGAFQDSFDKGAAISAVPDPSLEVRTAAIRAVRTAFFDLDAATREITMPAKAVTDVNAMYTAISDLVSRFDIQGAAKTTGAYQAANAASATAFKSADAAIRKVLTALGIDDLKPTTTATPTAPTP